MKRSGPPARRTPLSNKSAPSRRTGLTRTRTPTPAGRSNAGADWQSIFDQLAARSGGRCEAGTPWCLAPTGLTGLPRDQISIQHRRARGAGGTPAADTHLLGNLLIFCGTGVTGCHGWVETRERELAEQRGLWVRHLYDDWGQPVPVHTIPVTLAWGPTVLLHPTRPEYVPLQEGHL